MTDTKRMAMVVEGWPVLVEEIKFEQGSNPQFVVDWRLDVDNERFPDISKLDAAGLESVKNHVGEKLYAFLARDLAEVSGGQMIIKELKGTLNG